jgi:hypothetical protein
LELKMQGLRAPYQYLFLARRSYFGMEISGARFVSIWYAASERPRVVLHGDVTLALATRLRDAGAPVDMEARLGPTIQVWEDAELLAEILVGYGRELAAKHLGQTVRPVGAA